jgi:hypothetical protein
MRLEVLDRATVRVARPLTERIVKDNSAIKYLRSRSNSLQHFEPPRGANFVALDGEHDDFSVIANADHFTCFARQNEHGSLSFNGCFAFEAMRIKGRDGNSRQLRQVDR